MKCFWRVLSLGLVGLIFCFPGIAFATDVSREDQGVSKLGITWNIAKDRKIENDGGLYQPEGLDKYMRRLIDELSSKVDQLVEQNKVLEEKIDMLLQQSENLEKQTGSIPSRATVVKTLVNRPEKS